MKTANLKITFLHVLVASLFFIGCSKDSGGGPENPMKGYPKNVTIKYEVSSTTHKTGDVSYRNESGGDTKLDDVALPFSVEVKRSVKYGDDALLSGVVSVIDKENTNVTVKIFVDNKLVEENTANSNSVHASQTIVHVFH